MNDYAEYVAPLRTGMNDAMPSQRPVSLSTIIGRIEETVEAETHGLKTDRQFDLQSSNARKSRYLYELTRAMKGIGEADFLNEHRDGIRRLRDTLSKNAAVIRAHLDAVNEVANLMQDAIRHAETDGTYSAGAMGWGG